MKEQEFDNIIKQKLESVADTPPAYMWDKIAAGIPASAPVSGGMAASVKVALVAASVAIIAGLSFILMQEESHTNRDVIENVNYSNTEYQIKKRELNKSNEELNPTITETPINQSAQSTATPIEHKSNAAHKNESYTSNNKHTKAVNTKEQEIQNQEFDNLASKTKTHTSTNKKPAVATKAPEREAKKEDMAYQLAVAPIISPATKTVSNQKLEKPVQKTELLEASTTTNNQNTQNTEAEQLPLVAENQSEQVTEELNAQEEKVSEAVKEEVEVESEAKPVAMDVPKTDEENTVRENPKMRQLNKYGIGLHYGPEIIDVDGTKMTDQGFDFSFNYQNINFIVQTGLGLRFSQDKVAYDMEYKRWDYLETQIRFDSAVFVLDQNGNPVLQPVDPYYEEVYDSLNHSYHATATEQSMIIQIPVLLGYQKDFKNVAFFVKGGIRYSLVALTNTKDLFELDEQSRLVNINYPYRNRAKSNIDYELSIGGIYKLNENFQIHAEAFGRYYQYSIYEENTASGVYPWSLSGRIGLVYIFR
jgi:chemotaxis protein histidine kinase CheA